MSELLQWLQEVSLTTWLRESIWGYPILAALHVLGLAWFGGLVFFQAEARRLRWAGGLTLCLTGAVVFALHPVRYAQSTGLQVKLALLVLIGLSLALPRARRIRLGLWLGVLFASRLIAYF
jgi:hypothetical protein